MQELKWASLSLELEWGVENWIVDEYGMELQGIYRRNVGEEKLKI